MNKVKMGNKEELDQMEINRIKKKKRLEIKGKKKERIGINKLAKKK